MRGGGGSLFGTDTPTGQSTVPGSGSEVAQASGANATIPKSDNKKSIFDTVAGAFGFNKSTDDKTVVPGSTA